MSDLYGVFVGFVEEFSGEYDDSEYADYATSTQEVRVEKVEGGVSYEFVGSKDECEEYAKTVRI
jgi:hypothetical protein